MNQQIFEETSMPLLFFDGLPVSIFLTTNENATFEREQIGSFLHLCQVSALPIKILGDRYRDVCQTFGTTQLNLLIANMSSSHREELKDIFDFITDEKVLTCQSIFLFWSFLNSGPLVLSDQERSQLVTYVDLYNQLCENPNIFHSGKAAGAYIIFHELFPSFIFKSHTAMFLLNCMLVTSGYPFSIPIFSPDLDLHHTRTDRIAYVTDNLINLLTESWTQINMQYAPSSGIRILFFVLFFYCTIYKLSFSYDLSSSVSPLSLYLY